MSETWLPLANYEGRYEVSDLGNVRSLPRTEITAKGHRRPVRGRILKPMAGHDGYHQIALRIGGKMKMMRLSRIVATAFHGPSRPVQREVAHLDGTRTNDRADNLRWVSPAENTFHKRLHGTHQAGERHPRAKLTDEKVLAIRRTKNLSCAALGRAFGVSASAIREIRIGKRWKHLIEHAVPEGHAPTPSNPLHPKE